VVVVISSGIDRPVKIPARICAHVDRLARNSRSHVTPRPSLDRLAVGSELSIADDRSEATYPRKSWSAEILARQLLRLIN